jgi:hypothetical protein
MINEADPESIGSVENKHANQSAMHLTGVKAAPKGMTTFSAA